MPLRRIALINALLLAALYVASVIAFASLSENVAARFAALARGPYLMTAVSAQLRVLPAYVVMAAVASLLAWRPLSWLGVRRAWVVPVASAVIFLCALGPALKAAPGLFDTFARKLPWLDVYALSRWHVLDASTVVFFALVFIAVWSAGRWSPLVLFASCLLVGAPSSFERAKPAAKKNVLIIATDSWRFDRVGVHGAAHADLTPHIDAFARTATDFTNLHVATASTLEAWVTLLSGRWPTTHGIRSMYPSREEVAQVDADAAMLPRLLSRAGYDTFVSSDWAGNCFDLVDLGFTKRRVGPVQNFEALLLEATVRAHPLVPLFFGSAPGLAGEVLVPGRDALSSLARPEVLVEQLFTDVDASVRAQRPFFGVLFVSPTHLPYNARHPFNEKYVDVNYRGAHRYQVEVSAHELITTGFSPTLPRETIEHVRALYDDAVSDFDATVGDVLAGLEARGLSDDTIVIVTTDHGEDLYDSGSTLGHGTNFFGGDQSTHIPFFMRVPGREAGVNSRLSRTIDVAPTLLSLLGLEVPSVFEGASLDGAPAEFVYAETCYLFFPKSKAMTGLSDAERADLIELSGATDTLEVDASFRHNLVLKPEVRAQVIAAKDRMLRTERWKLIEIPGRTKPIRRLYDLSEDPFQRVNLAGTGLAVEEHLATQVSAFSN
ncbi:MAG: sulfatase [Archangium sp.]